MKMTEKVVCDQRKLNSYTKNEQNAEKKKGTKKLKQLKKKRLIIRNLSFSVSEEELKKLFSSYGEVLDVKIPTNEAGKKKGFAFVQFKETKAQIKAMKELNFKKIHGRPIAIDVAVDKNTYQSQQKNLNRDSKKERLIKTEPDVKNETEFDVKKNNLSIKSETKFVKEEDDDDDDDINSENGSKEKSEVNAVADSKDDMKVEEFFKVFDADKEFQEDSDNEAITESSDDEEQETLIDNDDDDDDANSNNEDIKRKPRQKKKSGDVSEGKTVFIRNISFQSTEEDLEKILQEYGDTVYCLFCIDSITGHFKGTAFAKFKEKECADKLIKDSSEEPGILLDGRKLFCTNALSQEELSKKSEPSEKSKDKRNLRLLKYGLIMYGSKESEGVSQTDMSKRAQLETAKKQKLKNVNFFVSDKRLVCHNLPKNVNDKDLFKLFKKAAGKESTIKEARVMRDFKKTDAQGIPVSRGFGFVAFTEHEHALKALMELNNNPRIFIASKRPIVEFSVENKVALLSQERRREKMKMRNKRPVVDISVEKKDDSFSNEKQKEVMKKKHLKNQKRKQMKSQKKKQQKTQNADDISALTKKYKERLLNKFC